MSARVKPRLRRAAVVMSVGRMLQPYVHTHEWVCSDNSDCFAYGWGQTPEAAYELWLTRFARCRWAQSK